MLEIEDIFLDKVNSTNIWAKEHVDSFDPNKITVITSEEQTNGIGRCKRRWISPPGGLYSTFYFRLKKNSLHITSIAHVISFSLAQIFQKKDLNPKIKWPNDILLSEKKISGILCETVFLDDYVDIFLGIGINVNLSSDELKKIDQPATSLFVETKKMWNEKDLLKKLEDQFAENLEIFKEKGFATFHDAYENIMAYIGKEIICTNGENKWTGILHSISCEGGLNLYLPNKEIKTFLSGDISVRTTS
jgi:BirA family biotin operon repressor/biotin-[acetyl-CoA-carboxylase] ligase